MALHTEAPDKKTILKQVKVIAVVGLSRRETRPGYYVPAYMHAAGYRIVPVNPYLDEAFGEKAYPDLLSIPEPVDMVVIFRRSKDVPPVVDEAIEIGAKAIWMQLGIVNEEAAAEARAAGLQVVMNSCIKIDHQRLLGGT
ncbi:MAG: CoA-binding protein [Anaerolineae bacterium]|nr:MAG: CoA-binding protein [Anaerolineae bacterium]